MHSFFIQILFAFFMVFCADLSEADAGHSHQDCTYEMQVWNVMEKNSKTPEKVRHLYGNLAPEEIDPASGCTVCNEDQEIIRIPPLPEFSVCYKLAPRIRDALAYLVQNGAPVHTVVGYHVIKSRGPVDAAGNRTGFSNHSFGIAVDINPEQNGLYDNCVKFGPECRLQRGGEWRPGTPGTIEKKSDIVSVLRQEGFHWGGEIEGKQKDFMHFSLTGY